MTKSLNSPKSVGHLIGESNAFKEQLEIISLAASSDANVFIFGETGTGKELCAFAVHSKSPRAAFPFIPLNCGTLPPELLENELFGHKIGAFTDASRFQEGVIQEAEGGTLFLDEVTSLPFRAQTKLLRFLQNKEFRSLGSTEVLAADVRIVAASNMEPEQAVQEGTISQSLYYRLNVISFRLPPLRERREDIPLLVEHFLKRYSRDMNKEAKKMSPRAMELLVLYDWPGNIRELEHVVQRAVVFSDKDVIQEEDLKFHGIIEKDVVEPFKEAKRKVIIDFERDYITKVLRAYHGNITRAAKAAGKNRRAFWELIRKHKIDVDTFRRSSGEKS